MSTTGDARYGGTVYPAPLPHYKECAEPHDHVYRGPYLSSATLFLVSPNPFPLDELYSRRLPSVCSH